MKPKKRPATLSAADAERALLGGVFLRGLEGWLDLEAAGITAQDFAEHGLAEVALAMARLAKRGEPVNVITVDSTMGSSSELVGGLEGLAKLDRHAVTWGNHAAIVARAAARRRVHAWHRASLARLEADESLADPDIWQGCLESAKAELGNLAASGVIGTDTVHITTVLDAAFQEMTNEACGRTRGISTGFPQLDAFTGGKGYRPGWLVVECGRPKMGKTTAALSMTRAALFDRTATRPWGWKLKERPTPVLWACDEMRNTELVQRMIADMADLEGQSVISPTVRWMEKSIPALQGCRDLLGSAPLEYVEDKDCGRLEKIFAAARRWRARHPVDAKGGKAPGILVIDYLQRMTMSAPAGASREERVSEMAKACKSLARELDIVVIVLAQLNRNLESRENKRPVLSDLRESGAIEQEADLIIGVYRPIIYDLNAPAARERYAELRRIQRPSVQMVQERRALQEKLSHSELIVMGNRHGGIGTCYADFTGEHYRFEAKPTNQENPEYA